MRVVRLCVASAATAGVLLGAGDARAVGTRTFELDTLDKLSGGDVRGVSVGSDGVVRAGWTLGDLAFPEGAGTTATCAVALADGSVLVGTGPAAGGKVVRIANGQASVFADTGENAVNALAVDRSGNVYAATTSSRIYRVSPGKAEVFATLPGVESVFALVADRSGDVLYAGTGSDGTVFRLERGASSVYFKTSDPFVVSLAADDGVVYAGTSGKGLLYRITGPGRASVLYDFPGEDVHAIAVGPNHTVFAIADEEPSGSAPDAGESASRARVTGGRNPPGPVSPVRSRPGKGSLWRFDAQGRPERLMHNDDFHYLSLAVDARGTPYVGTGAEGRIYTVDDAHAVSLVAQTTQRQIGAIGVASKAWFAIGSDPAQFHQVLSIGGADSVWTSRPLDAGVRARFGHVTWRSAGTVEVSTRSGDTQTPDGTWSPWSAPVAPGGAISSPPGRFVQVRARLRDRAASLADVNLAFVTQNLRAVVTEIVAHEHGATSREAIPSSGSEPPRHDSVVRLTWKVDNPDNDELRYRVQFRREGQSRWIDATRPDEVLTKPELDWDTSALPEGKYRLRVDASDEIVNPPADSLHFALESPPVWVDNTPPRFKSLAIQGRRLHAEVVDGLGPIVRVDMAVDGRPEWRPLAPVDGIFDTADETIDADVAPLLADPGPHIVALRAFDAAGNSVAREIETP